jgi:RimJ/RimL family protein N-acetyltransferase
LRLRLAGGFDAARFVLAGADDDAQRRLGWRSDQLVAPGAERRVRALVRGDAAGPAYDAGDGSTLLAALIGRDYVGGVQLAPVDGTDYAAVAASGSLSLGGVVVAAVRGRGIGSRMFALGAAYAHDQLGARQVVAGCPVDHEPSRRALLAAGFVPTDGPDSHTLPDGRALPSLWFTRTWV